MNPVFHKRSKHIEIKYHWIRQHVTGSQFGTARLIHVGTGDMTADIFTKALVGEPFNKHREALTGLKRKCARDVEDSQVKKSRKR